MAFHGAFPILGTNDVERLAGFYCDELGFTRGYRYPDEGAAEFVVVSLGDLSIGLRETANRDELGRVDFWLYTHDVDAEVERLVGSGATLVEQPGERAWGERMATVTDPDGNLLHIGSRGR